MSCTTTLQHWYYLYFLLLCTVLISESVDLDTYRFVSCPKDPKYPKITYNNVTCYLNSNYTASCAHWKVVAVFLFVNSSQIENHLQASKKYLSAANQHCQYDSQLQLLTPEWTTLTYADTCTHRADFQTESEGDLMRSLTVNDIQTPQVELDAVQDMLHAAVMCTTQPVLPRATGGVVLMFSDMICDLVGQSPIANDNLMIDLQALLNNGYNVRILLTNATHLEYCHDSLACLNCTLPECSLESLHSAAVESTCSKDAPLLPTKTPPDPGATTQTPFNSTKDGKVTSDPWELALIITIPLLIVVAVIIICFLKRRKILSIFVRKATHRTLSGSSQLTNSNEVNRPQKKDDWELDPKDLLIYESKLLGSGSSSNVYRGKVAGALPLLRANPGLVVNLQHQKNGFCKAAIKRLPLHANQQNRLDFMHEIDFMKRLGYHVHVISMLGCISDQWNPLIVVEYCHHGDLLKFLRRHRNDVPRAVPDYSQLEFSLRIKDLVSFAWQISDGMSYLASKQFVHRDLAARNILITKSLVAKVSDFGLCRHVDSALYTSKGGRLPIKWMAIESLKFYEFSTKSDVWAYGVCLFEIFSMGEGPYQSIQPLDMLKHLENDNRLDRPDKCPHEIYDLLHRCWHVKSELRPKFDEICSKLASLLNLDDEHYGYVEVGKRSQSFSEI